MPHTCQDYTSNACPYIAEFPIAGCKVHTSGIQIKLCKLTVEKIVLKKYTIPDIEFLIHSTGQININFFFLQFFEHNVWVFFIIVAIVIIAMDEVRVHWKAYSISTYEMRCHTELRFYDIIIGQGNELM